MHYTFNLIDQPWIPCRERGSPAVRELGIRETIERAHQLSDIACAVPTETVAITRMLLAVLHRAFAGPRNADAWERLWRAERFSPEEVSAYLDQWRSRFDLFDAARPFYQTAEVTERYAQSITRLSFVGDANAALFDHVNTERPPAVPASQAARMVLSCQAFDTGGLKSFESGREKEDKSAEAAPLIQSAVAVIKGDNLFETLMLNLVRYDGRAGYPFEFDPAADAPAWEHDIPARSEPRFPRGHLDVLTWQARRIRLVPEPSVDGPPVVRQAVLMKGHGFANGVSPPQIETMVSFSRIENPRANQRPWNPMGFREGRALWRDAGALFGPKKTKSLEWLATLINRGVVAERVYEVEYIGLTAERAKPLFWRHERLPLPAAILDDVDLHTALQEALDFAERVGQLVARPHPVSLGTDEHGKERYAPSPVRLLAEGIVGSNPDDIDALVRHLAPDQRYWPLLDIPFRSMVEQLPGDRTTDRDGAVRYGAHALRAWREAAVSAARQAFASSAEGLDTTARGIRARARAEQALEYGLRAILEAAEPSLVHVGDAT